MFIILLYHSIIFCSVVGFILLLMVLNFFIILALLFTA